MFITDYRNIIYFLVHFHGCTHTNTTEIKKLSFNNELKALSSFTHNILEKNSSTYYCTCTVCVETGPLSACHAGSKRPKCWRGHCFVCSLPRSAFSFTFTLLLLVLFNHSLQHLPTKTNVVILLQRHVTVATQFSGCSHLCESSTEYIPQGLIQCILDQSSKCYLSFCFFSHVSQGSFILFCSF